MDKLTKWVYLIVIPVHAVLLVILCLTGCISWNALPLIIIWIIINYAFGLFVCIFANACFHVSSKWKYITYPIGGIFILTIFAAITFPIGVVGVIIGICQPGT